MKTLHWVWLASGASLLTPAEAAWFIYAAGLKMTTVGLTVGAILRVF